MADVKQELPEWYQTQEPLPVPKPRPGWRVQLAVIMDDGEFTNWRLASFNDLLVALPLLEPEQEAALVGAIPSIAKRWKELVEGRDAAIKRAEHSNECFNEACANIDILRAENEKLRAELATVIGKHDDLRQQAEYAADEQRFAIVAALDRADCPSSWQRIAENAPRVDPSHALVTDAPSKLASNWVGNRQVSRYGVALGVGPRQADAIAREIAAWDAPAPKLKELCASGPCELETHEGLCGAPGQLEYLRRKFDGHTEPAYRCAKHRNATNSCWEPAPPKSRCGCINGKPDVITCRPDDCPEHGVNRPGQALDEWTDEKCDEMRRRWDADKSYAGLTCFELIGIIKARNARIRELEDCFNKAMKQVDEALDLVNNRRSRLSLKCAQQRRELRRLNQRLGLRIDNWMALGGSLQATQQRVRELESELATLRAKESPEAAWARALQNAHVSVGVVLHLPYQPPEK